MRQLSVAVFGLLLAASCAFAQNGNAPVTPYAQQSALFTNTGANSWVVPANVTVVYVDGCSGGQGGAGGQASATGGAGGGGGGALCTIAYPLNVTPGATLTITVGAAGLGSAAGSNGGIVNVTTTITGANNTFPAQTTATAAQTGSAGAGGNGGQAIGVGGNNAVNGGNGGSTTTTGSAGGIATSTSIYLQGYLIYGTSGAGGGGSNATTGQNGSTGGQCPMGPGFRGNASAAYAGGGGGGCSAFGTGGVGGGGGASDTCGAATGFGAGGGGGASNGAGCNGSQGFVLLRY